ncbi:hypothetical protein OTU49_005468 [Cherax quadricarinatus]|uniref:G-protein coupled receptors family 2 profile 2 domain-containing protein n=1 Tax=Cherax quadricarinatus TaxID=27406 RepID=A0AAW0Y6N1_CHEQU
MISSVLFLLLSISGLLGEGWCNPVDRSPARSCVGNVSTPCSHTGVTTSHGAQPLPPRIQDSQGNEVKAREVFKTPVTQERLGIYAFDDGEEPSNNTLLDLASRNSSELPALTAAELNHHTANDIFIMTDVQTNSSGQPQEQSHIDHTTSKELILTQNVTMASHEPHDEIMTKNEELENITKTIIRENSAYVVYQNSTPASVNNSHQSLEYRDRRTVLVHNAPVQSDSHVNTELESIAHKQEISAVKEGSQYVERTPVRKCCGFNEFFSLISQQCEAVDKDTGFTDAVHELLEENVGRDLQFVTGLLQQCPSTGDVPAINEANSHSFSILSSGHLKEHIAGTNYDHDHYCLELASSGPDQFASGVLVAALCHPWPSEVYTRKCCDLDEYYDHALKDCRPRLANMSDTENLVYEFSKNNPRVSSIHVSTGRLKCSRGAPRIVVADQAFLDSANQLCERQSGHCYPSTLYCIEYLWAEGDTTLTAVASVCPLDSFHKCCPRNHILTETGCIEASGGDVSARMLQLLEVMEPQFGFPTEVDGGQCVQEWITPNDSEIRWWINKSGYLAIDAKAVSYSTMRYCVDDYVDPNNQTQTVALMCYTELENIVPVHLSAQPSEAGSVGKCCPHDQYMTMDGFTCVSDNLGLSLLQNPLVHAANVTKLTFTSFPTCESEEGYHYYYIDPTSFDDHVELVAGQALEVVSVEGRCVLGRQLLRRENYCLEYGVDGSNIRPIVLVCPDTWKGMDVHTEKFGLTAVLLGFSCAALFATAFSLISTRVRRGLVTVKKVNTLAGRILLSYVLAYLVAFLLLAVNMKVEVSQDNIECQTMAGLLTFFLLAAFQWNTSICLESLLLTLRVSTSERWRYVLHSVWAWGVPGFITALALSLDHYRTSLPCNVITPRVGLYKCFFSDRDAKLVYLYVPMLLSLSANVVLLAAARYVRSAKLRRLEHGGPKSRTTGTEDPKSNTSLSKDDNANTTTSASHPPVNLQHSGLRTHQTRNLWTESVKLVVWSGATWLMEVIAFVVAQYIAEPTGSWYDYLWYLPSSVNALRGVGIFYILVLTPENRVKLARVFSNLGGSLAGVNFPGKSTRARDGTVSSGNHQSSIGGGSGSEVRGPGRRNMSIATTITQFSSISSSHSHDSRADTATGRTRVHPRVAHSISQIDTRRSSASSASSDCEGFELDNEISGGGRRKSSLATFGGVSLPSVDEEDVFEEAPTSHTSLNITKSTSDA